MTVEIHGLPDADGRFVPEDVSGFKSLSMQVYATGIEILRLEAIAGNGQGHGDGIPADEVQGATGLEHL